MWDKANLVLPSASDVVWYQDHTGWSWMFGLHGLFWLLLIILIVSVLVISLRLATRDGRSTERAAGSLEGRRSNDARDTFEKRYARSETDRADYLERKHQLS